MWTLNKRGRKRPVSVRGTPRRSTGFSPGATAVYSLLPGPSIHCSVDVQNVCRRLNGVGLETP